MIIFIIDVFEIHYNFILVIGKTINNYVIERKLGDGGMGDVYYAKHNKIDREVAIKVLHSHLFSNENIHNRFKNEANALIKLDHPHIVKIYDYVEQDNSAYLIMEYINGYTLDDYISKLTGPLPSVKASSIICSVLDAVQYAHDNNVFHRDIKPANIMLSHDSTVVRIMDFGIAKLTDSKNFKTTHANTQLGTPFYMSPEQIKGLSYSRMSDIYSLGVTLFEMVTGKCPYHEITSLFELQSKIVNEPLPHTNDYYPGVSIRIQNAIIKATQKAPELRFQTCNDFKNYLLESDAYILSNISSPSQTEKPNKVETNWPTYIITGFASIIFIVLASLFLSRKSDSNAVQSGNTLKSSQVQIVIDSVKPPDTNQVALIHDKNLTILDNYIAKKLENANTSLSSKNKTRLINEIQSIDNLISINDLSPKYDGYFVVKPDVVKPTVKKLNNQQILKDFWNDLAQKKDLCRTIFDTVSQISGIHIINSNINSDNPPDDISITVTFMIAPSDDPSDTTTCSSTLKYKKTGNEYILIK